MVTIGLVLVISAHIQKRVCADKKDKRKARQI